MATTDTGSAAVRAAHVESVQAVELPDRVERLADEYDRHFAERDRFLWRWIHSLFPSFTLSSVSEEYADHVRTQKTVLTMYVTVLDDLAENHGDRRTVREARRLAVDHVEPDPARAAVDAETFAFIERLWDSFESGLESAPRREAFADAFAYDFEQTTDAMAYSALVSETPGMANVTGATRHGAHNMVMFPYADVDLMYSPSFDPAEFGAVRDALWTLQELARIGNWVTTWEREVREGDFSAGVVVAALEDGVVSPADLTADPDAAVEAIRDSGIEARFRRRWHERFAAARSRDRQTDTVDLAALVKGMETVFESHLATRGLK